MCCCIQVKELWKKIEISLEDSLEILFVNVPFVPMDFYFTHIIQTLIEGRSGQR